MRRPLFGGVEPLRREHRKAIAADLVDGFAKILDAGAEPGQFLFTYVTGADFRAQGLPLAAML